MMRSKSSRRFWRQVVIHAIMGPLALIWLFPLWMMAVFSTMPENGIFSPDIELLPSDQFWVNFQALQAETGFLRTLFVSVLVALISTVLSVMLTSMAGWALVRYQFRGKILVTALIFGTMTLPYFVVVVPQFIMVARDLGLSNTWVALIVPSSGTVTWKSPRISRSRPSISTSALSSSSTRRTTGSVLRTACSRGRARRNSSLKMSCRRASHCPSPSPWAVIRRSCLAWFHS